MKHRGPGASLSPGRDAARAAARPAMPRQQPARPPATTSAAETAAPGDLSVTSWRLVEDPDSGALVAVHIPTGTRRVLATPPTGGSPTDG